MMYITSRFLYCLMKLFFVNYLKKKYYTFITQYIYCIYIILYEHYIYIKKLIIKIIVFPKPLSEKGNELKLFEIECSSNITYF